VDDTTVPQIIINPPPEQHSIGEGHSALHHRSSGIDRLENAVVNNTVQQNDTIVEETQNLPFKSTEHPTKTGIHEI
jgi:hypothetical protein